MIKKVQDSILLEDLDPNLDLQTSRRKRKTNLPYDLVYSARNFVPILGL